MKDEVKVNLVDLLGEEKASKIFKQTEQSERLRIEREESKKADLERMTKSMIDKGYLLSSEYYSGYRFRGKHVAMWDGQEDCFKSIKFEMGIYGVESIKYFGDVANTSEDGFIPFDKIEVRKI